MPWLGAPMVSIPLACELFCLCILGRKRLWNNAFFFPPKELVPVFGEPPILTGDGERPPAATATGADDSRGPSFEGDNDDDVAPMSPMSSRAAGDDDRSRTTRSTGSSNEGDVSELEISPSLNTTRDNSLSFDASVMSENDRNRMRDIGSAELMASGEAARPVSAAWL